MSDETRESPSLFLGLPFELRRRIFEWVFTPLGTIYCLRKIWDPEVDLPELQTSWSFESLTPLLLTCRQVRMEARENFYSRTRYLDASNQMVCPLLLTGLPTTTLRNLETIYLSYTSVSDFAAPDDFLAHFPNLRTFTWELEKENRSPWNWLVRHAYSDDFDDDFLDPGSAPENASVIELLRRWKAIKSGIKVEYASIYSAEEYELVREGVAHLTRSVTRPGTLKFGNSRIRLAVKVDVSTSTLTRKTVKHEIRDEKEHLWHASPIIEKSYD